MKTLALIWLAVTCLIGYKVFAQQIPDTSFAFIIQQPRYEVGKGNAILVDAAHYNFHTLEGRYAPFGKVLRSDGYQLFPNTSPITAAALGQCRILVISNSLDSSNQQKWQLPILSAFSLDEISTINHWVKSGGRLLLIADHMPFAGAAQALAKSFGFEFANCFAMDNRRRNLERFYRGNGALADSEITRGVDTVITFTGSAFRIPKGAKPILTLKDYTIVYPRVAWQFEEDTPTQDSRAFYQGAYMAYGKGKIVVMGEAAMFSAQLAGPVRATVGFNHPAARQNANLLINIIHWLDD